MSTKTLHKRIALVAVSALGFGLMSTMPANAAVGDNIASYSAPTTYSVNSGAATLGAAANIGTVTITQVPGITPLQVDDDVHTLTLSANSQVAITGASSVSDVVTVSAVGHTFKVGDIVTMQGITATTAVTGRQADYTGDKTIVSIVAGVSFTYANDNPDSTATIAGGDDFVTLKKDLDFLGNVSFSLTPVGSTTSAAAANLVTNSIVTPGATTMVMTPVSASFTSAIGTATLIAGAALPAAANGGKIKYTLTSAGGDTSIATFSSVLTLTFSPLISGTRTISPTTGVANIAAGGSATLTVTQPYTGVVTGTPIPGETFTLTPNTPSVQNSTITVTGTATGGSATVVRTASNSFASSLLKDTNTGAFSVTYTITVTAPANAVQGDTITVAAGTSTFTLTVFGGQAWNGTLTTLSRAENAGWLGGNSQMYASAAATASIGTVTVNSGTGSVPTLNPAWTFTMTGVGNFSVNGGARASYQAVPAQAASLAAVDLFADGRPGVGTLTITANGNVVATQVVNFYGPATQIKITPVYTIATAGDGTTGFLTGGIDDDNTCITEQLVNGAVVTQKTFNGLATCIDTSATSTNDPALVIEVLDALGTRIPAKVGVNQAVVMTSSNTAVISSTPTSFLDAGVAGKTAGILLNHVGYTTTATAKSGDSATLTFTHINSLGATITATQAVTVGGGSTKGGKVTVALDKTSYSPGERMKLTVTALDASGNKVADNVAVGSLSGNKAVQGLVSGYYYDGSYILGDDVGEDLFAPFVDGPFEITLFSGTASGATVKVAGVVNNFLATNAAEAAADAAAEAIDAANAATDAANLAAEAADAATVAAEEARDAADAATAAVEELATQVATLMAALKAQITTLPNTVAKIAKKVKA